jgi:diacylglycerol kinase family enzyme
MRSHLGRFECRFTAGPGDAARIAREEAARGRALLVAFGGDGTISESARGILESGMPAELGILPHGTGGDLVRSLALPTGPADAARALRRGRTVAIDVGLVVFEDGRERSFVNSASFGLSAEVARRVSRGGGVGYIGETMKAASGYGMKMAPEATLTDGLLDLVVVKKLSLAKLVCESPLLYLGAHLGLSEVEHGRVRVVEARSVNPVTEVLVEIDGEVEDRLPARFEIRRRALRIRI